MQDGERPIGPEGAADIFAVSPKTIARWASAGEIPHFTTPGGHRRFYASELIGLVESRRGESRADTTQQEEQS